MTPTADMLSGIKPDGSREQPRETVGKILVAKQVPKIVKVACRFAKARQRKTVVYILGAGDPATNRPDTPMTRRTAEQLMNSLGDHRFEDGLDLIVGSSGGDIHAAYLIMSMLRERMKDEEGKVGEGRLIACVPSRAMSAATLLCIGADDILLGELGAVGPLDAQIRKGVTDAGTPNYTSALHLLKALSRLQEFSLESFTAMADHLDVHRASHDDQIKYGIEYSRAITSPLFEHIESGEVGYWDQMLKTGEEYARRLLERGHLVMEDGKSDREALITSIVHQLVFDYPSHELVIDSDALGKLKLRAGLIPKDNGARRISGQFAERASETLIMLVDPNGAPAPEGSNRIPLKDWQKIGTDESVCDTDTSARDMDEPACDMDEPTRDIVWTDEAGSTFAMRVALYRPTVKRRKRWDKLTAANGGPATLYGPWSR